MESKRDQPKTSEEEPKQAKPSVKEKPDGRKSKDKSDSVPVSGASASGGSNARKKTTDELIEEYERKIQKTKTLLEEEKKRVAKKPTSDEQ
jgi:hypothetical protein